MTTHAGRWSHKLDVLFCKSGDQIQQFRGASQWEFLDSETLKLGCYMYVCSGCGYSYRYSTHMVHTCIYNRKN